MTFFQKLEARSAAVDSFLCLGLDPTELDVEKFSKTPKYEVHAKKHLKSTDNDPNLTTYYKLKVYLFFLLEAALDFAACVKPNLAFFLAFGVHGVQALTDVCEHLNSKNVPVLLDCKFADVRHTTEHFKKFVFGLLKADACTFNCYLGVDSYHALATDFFGEFSHTPFVVVKTSNDSSDELQSLQVSGNVPLYLKVVGHFEHYTKVKKHKCAYVMGATALNELKLVRQTFPDAFLFVPGLGPQGGDLRSVVEHGLTSRGDGLLVSFSRSVSGSDDPRAAAKHLRDEANKFKKEFRKH